MTQQRLKLRSKKTGLVIERVTPVDSARWKPKDLLSPQNFASWTPYQGQAITGCIVVPPAPEAGNPAFAVGFALPDMTPGADYYVELPLSIGVPAAGQTITAVVASPPYPWITYTPASGSVPARLSGRIPSNASAITMPIRLEQTGNKQITQGFVIEAPAGVVYALVEWNAQNRQLLPRIGGRSTVAPTLSMRGLNEFTDVGMYTCRGLDTGTQYPARYHWDYPGYVGIPSGIYVIKINHLGQILYAALEVGANTFDTVLLLTANDPLATGAAQIQSINVSVSRLQSEQKATFTIVASSLVVLQTTGPNGYNSGQQISGLVGPNGTAGLNDYRYASNDLLAPGTYTTRANLVSSPGIFKDYTFTVGSGTAGYELLELYEGDPLGPVSQVEYAHAAGGSGQFSVWAKLNGNFALELDIRKAGESENFGLMDTGTYGDGFTKFAQSFEGAPGEVFTLSGRQQGFTTVLFSVQLPALPQSNVVARTSIYP